MTDTPSRADEKPELFDPEADVTGKEDEQPNAVLIVKITDENGVRTEVQPLGDVQPTEVQTLIELGLQSWRAKIGRGR